MRNSKLLRLLSALCLAALLISCLPSAFAYGHASTWAKAELEAMDALGLIPAQLEERHDLREPHHPTGNVRHCRAGLRALHRPGDFPVLRGSLLRHPGSHCRQGIRRRPHSGLWRRHLPPGPAPDPAGILRIHCPVPPSHRAPHRSAGSAPGRLCRCRRRERLGHGIHLPNGNPGRGARNRRDPGSPGQHHLRTSPGHVLPGLHMPVRRLFVHTDQPPGEVPQPQPLGQGGNRGHG